jgi:hypothetical protein
VADPPSRLNPEGSGALDEATNADLVVGHLTVAQLVRNAGDRLIACATPIATVPGHIAF